MKNENSLLLVGKRIRYLRLLRHLSQEDLALDSGICKNYLSDVENGKRNISIGVLKEITNALEISFEDFFKGFGL